MRKFVLPVAFVILGATLGTAGPASASNEVVPPCVEGAPERPPIQSVRIEDQIYVDPTYAPDDAVAQAFYEAEYTVWWVNCWLDRLTIEDPAYCLAQVVVDVANSMDPLAFYFRYVSVQGTTVAINHTQLMADAGSARACLPQNWN